MSFHPVILVVDNNHQSLDATIRALQKADYGVARVTTGSEALEQIHALHPALVLLDLDLPDLTGLEVLRTIREDSRLNGITVVLLGAIPLQPEHQAEGVETGADGYIVRPFTNEELLGRVHFHLRQRELTERLRASEAQFSSAFNHAAIGMALVAPDGRYLKVNRALCTMFGYSEAELLIRTYQEITHPEDRDDRSSQRRNLLAGGIGSFQLEKRYLHKLGHIVWGHLSISVVRDETGRPLHLISQVQDITERKLAEENTRATEERLRIVTENSRVGLVMVDRERRYTFANKAYGELLGLPSTDICGRRVSEVLAPLYESQIRPRLDRAFAGERVSYELQKPDIGVNRVYAVRYEPTGPTDDVSQVVVVITDITEHTQAEIANRRLAAIVESSDDAIIGKDLTGIITSWNKGASRIFGYSSAEMVGGPISVLIPPDQLDEENYILERIRRGESVNHFETLRLTRGGDLIDVSLTASPILDSNGVVIGASKVARDITARKQGEAALWESRGKLEAALASMSDAVFISNQSGILIEFNDAFATFHRFPDRAACVEYLSRYPDVLDVHLPDGTLVPLDMWAVPRALRGETATNVEYKLRRKDTGETWIGSCSFGPIRDPDGTIVGSVVVARDVTDLKKLEQQVFRANRMESIGTLAGGIAHDLNNVLAPILMSLDLMMARFPDPSSQEMLATTASSAQRGADMVRQLLFFARGDEGERRNISLEEIILDVRKIANDTFLKHIEIQTLLPKKLWQICGDSTQIHQVLLNLCVNARDAMPDGGLLGISAANVTLDENDPRLHHGNSAGRYVYLQVEDTGSGMSPALAEQIFDPFFTTKSPGHGTGLGLSTSLAIVKGHGGFLQLESEPGAGTRFRVYLPAVQDETETDPSPKPTSLPRGEGELILVVDDEDAVRTITRKALEMFGYRVVFASDGAEAIDVFDRHRSEIAAVLTDMMMPVMDGNTAIQALLQMDPALPIIAASGLPGEEQVSRALALGVKQFLPKPYSVDTLLHAIRQALSC